VVSRVSFRAAIRDVVIERMGEQTRPHVVESLAGGGEVDTDKRGLVTSRKGAAPCKASIATLSPSLVKSEVN